MLQYKIPQNVQVEDKIFGNILTLRQLIYIMIGGGISYVVYTMLARIYVLNILEVGFICIPLVVAGAFAFIEINNVTLLKYCFLIIEFFMKPQKRVWNKAGDIIIDTSVIPKKKDATKKNEQEAQTVSDIDELSKALDIGSLNKKQGSEKIYRENNAQ